MMIRPLNFQDRDQILRLLRERGMFNETEVQVAMEVLDEALCHPEKQDYYAFCAYDDSSKVMAYICFGPIPLTETCYDLYWIAVDEEFSRRGIGAGLLESMEDFVSKKGGRKVYVETSSTPLYEAARSFYAKQGYELVSVLKDFYRAGDHKMIFVKELSPVVL